MIGPGCPVCAFEEAKTEDVARDAAHRVEVALLVVLPHFLLFNDAFQIEPNTAALKNRVGGGENRDE